jgi:hypothetical protein
MWWLKVRSPQGSDDRGAMALIVAIVVPVLLVGIGALIVDVGGWYTGRAQDQNGADAAAVAVANTCSSGACDTSVASTYIDSGTSPNGGLAHQYKVCGLASAGGAGAYPLQTCASQGVPEDGKACPAAPTSNYVDVLAMPKNDDGTGTITSLFGKGKQAVGACAQVQWGPAGYGGGVALTVSYCDWNNYTNGGTTFAPAPPYPPYPASPYAETVLQFKQVTDTSCPHGPAGGTPIPGGFGRLDPNSSDACTATFSSTGWYSAAPGNGNADGWLTECPGVIDADWANQTIVEIPVFDAANNGGANGQYHLNNLAAFVITAYFIQNGNQVEYSKVPGSPYVAANFHGSNKLCGGNTCLIGYFVSDTDQNAPPGAGGLNGGVTVPPKLTG